MHRGSLLADERLQQVFFSTMRNSSETWRLPHWIFSKLVNPLDERENCPRTLAKMSAVWMVAALRGGAQTPLRSLPSQ